MGASLCTSKKRPDNKSQKQIRVIVTNHSKQSVVGSNIDKVIEKNKEKDWFNEIGDKYLSFLPEQNNVSFVLYGEELSKVR